MSAKTFLGPVSLLRSSLKCSISHCTTITAYPRDSPRLRSPLKRRFYCTSSILQLEITGDNRLSDSLFFAEASRMVLQQIVRVPPVQQIDLEPLIECCSSVSRRSSAPKPRRLSTETSFSDRITLNRYPWTVTFERSAEISRLAT